MQGRVRTLRIPHSALRILAALWRLNLAEELQYRANFVASVLGTLFWIGTALLTLALFFRHTTRLGGWDYWEVVVLLGVFNALTGVIEAVLRPGIGRLGGRGRSGGLDLVLAKPVDAQGFVSFRRSEEHTSELQSQSNLVCRLLLEKKKTPTRPR